MGAGIAARAAKLIGVEKVVPIHFGTFPILSGTPGELRDASDGAFEVIELELP
jgi:L-ascorbate metabolism protein UlaG (beta-lactamase superfamily)